MKRFNIILAIAAVICCLFAFTINTNTEPKGNSVGTEINNIAPELKLSDPIRQNN